MAGKNTVPDLWRRARDAVATHPVAATVAFITVVTAVFLLAPSIDLWFSGLFYRPEGRFFLAREPLLGAIRRSGETVVTVIAAALIVQLVLKVLRPDRPSLVPPNVTLFLISTLVLGPGLLVNVILKDQWGRPRPVMIEAFGGRMPYVEVWRITDHCARNCSFVAGEASSAVWLMALALVVPARWRLPVAVVTGIYALVLSFIRLAFGGHFLSDVLISWGLTALVILLAWRFIMTSPPPWLENDRLEAGLTRFGWRLRGRAGSGA